MRRSKAIFQFTFAIIICVYFNLNAQQNRKQFDFVKLKDGISKVAVSTITQDDKGFIWIGTNGAGIYKFDGINYISYKHQVNDSTSLSSSLIHSSFLDSKNQLWIGTDNGLNLYDKDFDRFRRIPFHHEITERGIDIAIFSISGDAQGNIHLGSFENGFFIYDQKSGFIRKSPSDIPDNYQSVHVNTIKINSTGKTFAGTSLGLKYYDSKDNIFKTQYLKTKDGHVPFKVQIQSIAVINDDTIWLGTVSNGLFKITFAQDDGLDKITPYSITDKRILAITELKDKTLLVGTENDGLFHLAASGSLLKHYKVDKTDKNSIGSNSIWSLFEDKDQRIWFGYYNNGVEIYDPLYDKFKELESLPFEKNSLSANSVNGIVRDELNRLWIGMDGGGIDVYDPVKKTFLHLNDADSGYSGLSSSDVQTIFIDSKNNLWVGTWNHGLFYLKSGTKSFVNYNSQNTQGAFLSDRVMSFAEDQDGTIWVGTFYSGLVSYNPENKTFTHHKTKPFLKHELLTSAIRKVLVDHDNILWLGTTKGLFKVHKSGIDGFDIEPIAIDPKSNGQNKTSANHILSLYEDTNNLLWIGTNGSGLSSYDKEKQEYIFYNELYNIEEEIVSSIIESDDGAIWISGNSGLSKIDRTKKTLANYTVSDGLLSNNFNFNAVLKDSEGLLYFGNYKGLDYFNSYELKMNEKVPSLYLTGLKIFNEEVTPDFKDSPLKKVISETSNITLNHKQSVFTIDYIGLNYTRSEKNKYAYYLEGFEESWNFVDNLNSATYTNLDAGEYTFKLKASNNDGVWTNDPLTFKIKILPPWWKTYYAGFAYVSLFFLCIYLLNKMTKNRLKERQLIKNERIERMQEDKLNKKKLQFFTNISHEFRTPLSLMISPLEDIIRDESLNLPPRVEAKHRTIKKNVDRLYRLINELLDFRKLELDKLRMSAKELNLVSFTKNVTSYFKEEVFNRNIHLAVDADLPNIPIWADESMLEKIIFNILSNAVKVTPDGGAINIDILSTDNLITLPLLPSKPRKVVEIIISDTGPGLAKDEANKIFQRFYQVDNLNKTYYGGTGIGLEVVKNFVQIHKGEIEVNTELGKGTSFRILFPFGNEHLMDDQLEKEPTKIDDNVDVIFQTPENPHVPTSPISEDSGKLNRLLIVEDNSELRNYLKEEFTGLYRVVVAKNGVEAIKMAKELVPDIILSDVIMPEMDGFTFCKLIKEDLRTSHIPLLMLTAKTKIDDRLEGIGMGADAYMAKPFDMRLLKLRLAQLITSRKLIFDKYFSSISGADENENTSSLDKDFIHKVLDYINDNMSDSDLSVELLASQLHLSRSQLYRKVKTLTGQTVNEFLRKVRLQRAKQIIETNGDVNISEVCYKVGFSSPSYFTKCFKAHFGVLPTEIEELNQ